MFLGSGSTRRLLPAAKTTRPARPSLRGNPYLFLGRRPFRETRVRSYIISQHRAGRPLSEIIDDPHLRRLGSESFVWRVIQDPRTIEALERDVREAIEHCSPRGSASRGLAATFHTTTSDIVSPPTHR
jgi:hypothetical protein